MGKGPGQPRVRQSSADQIHGLAREVSHIKRKRFGRHGDAGEYLTTLKWSVGLVQVANSAGEEARHTSAAASCPAAKIDWHRILLRKFE